MNSTRSEDCGVRDSLARERTYLANERTFLAYVRTAIMLLASGVTLIKLFGTDRALLVLGYFLVPLSIATGLMGYVRFIRFRERIDESESDPGPGGK
jgi:putative membrane protein